MRGESSADAPIALVHGDGPPFAGQADMSPSSPANATRPAELEISTTPAGVLQFLLSGRLDVFSVGALWQRALSRLRTAPETEISIDCAGVEYCDTAGIALLLDLLHPPRADTKKMGSGCAARS
jgi:ABC-type transporter Mla MlaB component